jgi:triacylglycerol esterase/lipase EstA (alpha/beta hydrolase family)
MRPINLAVLSLGALLIQLILGRLENELEVTDNMDISTIVSKREAGRRLEEEILVRGGLHYANAVKWCLDSVYGVSGLQDDKFCQNFYEAVVAPLEDDIQAISI